jgi:cell wall-associated NlpC family hydrolase
MRAQTGSGNDRWVLVSVAAAVVLLVALVGYVGFRQLGDTADQSATDEADAAAIEAAAAPAAGSAGVAGSADPAALTFQRVADPARTVAKDAAARTVAVFTDGARSVRINGTTRTFTEPKFTDAAVSTDAWIRLAPKEWKAGEENAAWFRPWLTAALTDTSPDALAVATQYLHGAPDQKDNKGVRYAGDADFGPFSETDPDGRAENSDFFDYLGVKHQFPDGGRSAPQSDRFGDLDCSGYLRMVYGYRLGYPLRSSNTAGVGLPRRAFAMAQFGPGAPVIPNRGTQVRDFNRLQPGDLVFFDLDGSDGPQADHSGIYLGLDDAGHHRFLSSRSKANGPTFGDFGGAAILDGGGHFATKFRSARRL